MLTIFDSVHSHNAHLENLILTKSISGNADSDGMIPLSLATGSYVPVAFKPTIVISPTMAFGFGAYSTSWYLMIKDKTGAKIASGTQMAGTLFYMSV